MVNEFKSEGEVIVSRRGVEGGGVGVDSELKRGGERRVGVGRRKEVERGRRESSAALKSFISTLYG